MEFQRFYEHQSPQLPPNPQLSKISHLQQELQSLLDRHDLSENDKSQRCGKAATLTIVSPKSFRRNDAPDFERI